MKKHDSIYAAWGKRAVDITISAAGLPLLALLTLVIGPAIKLEDGGPILYRANRVGLDGRTFDMLKFRSMKVGAPDLRNPDGSTIASSSDSRVTKVGRLLRQMSLDETPQLLNILAGQMSLVGPRPHMAPTAERPLTESDILRLRVKPGVTGLAQSLGRNELSSFEKEKTDASYVESLSALGDLRIILRTLRVVARREGINTN